MNRQQQLQPLLDAVTGFLVEVNRHDVATGQGRVRIAHHTTNVAVALHELERADKETA